MWGCGLKLARTCRVSHCARSPPMWGCGLKLTGRGGCLCGSLSPPMWGCGLKQQYLNRIYNDEGVTPHVGVWIETPMVVALLDTFEGHPPCGGVD